MLLKPLFSILLLLAMTSPIGAQAAIDTCRPAKVAFYVEVSLGAKDGVSRLYQAEEFAASFHCGTGRPSASDLERCKADYERRRKLIVDPIIGDLKSRMFEVARSEGFSLFEGVALDESKSLMALEHRLDLTSQFIHHFNDASFKPGPKPHFEVPAFKVAAINSRKLYGRKGGLRGFESVTDFDSYCESGKCKVLYDRLQAFSIGQNYGAIFDSGRDLPEQIKAIACHDATDQFIEYFNQRAVSH